MHACSFPIPVCGLVLLLRNSKECHYIVCGIAEVLYSPEGNAMTGVRECVAKEKSSSKESYM